MPDIKTAGPEDEGWAASVFIAEQRRVHPNICTKCAHTIIRSRRIALLL